MREEKPHNFRSFAYLKGEGSYYYYARLKLCGPVPQNFGSLSREKQYDSETSDLVPLQEISMLDS